MKHRALKGKNSIVTIDGPVGSGKSTIGKLLASRRGLLYLDTGAMYRCVALQVKTLNVDPDDHDALEALCMSINISFRHDSQQQRVFLNNRDVTRHIRNPEISMLASRVSDSGPVRKSLVNLQRQTGRDGGIVVDGRDAGTVIFPGAEFKFFLDATVEERAERRYKELVEKKIKTDYTDVFQGILKRDRDDSSRKLSPLKPAKDAVIIDTTGMTIGDVLDRITGEIESGKSSLT